VQITIDLTPFGFTPTESLAYAALLEHGPLGGYALSKALAIARTNAYQALNGLEAKGAAEGTHDSPRRFRPVHPDALLAAIMDREAKKIDSLELTLRRSPSASASQATTPITSVRSLEDLVLRAAARTKGPIDCIGPARFLERLAPAWHKRLADGSPTRLWVVGPGGNHLPIPFLARLEPPAIPEETALAVMGSVVVVAWLQGAGASGYWSNDPLQMWLVALALRALTA